MRFLIVGAGTSGLLAGAMLRNECKAIWERKKELPNNHSALLRFRTSIVGDTLGIPFKKVKIMKAAVPYVGNPVGDAIAYALKTSGTASLRSVTSALGAVEERWIAPTDLVAQMVEKVTSPLRFSVSWRPELVEEGIRVISTMPMPTLMKLLGWETKSEFKYVDGWTVRADLRDCDVCATLYFPEPDFAPYRASITRDLLIIEYADHEPKEVPEDIDRTLVAFGLSGKELTEGSIRVEAQPYAKIIPIDDTERKRFIMWASDNHGVYSLGRYATWRPGLLMDDLVNDVRVIRQIASEGRYDQTVPRKVN